MVGKEALEGVFRAVGWPGTLVTDGGSAFKNKDVLSYLKVKRRASGVYSGCARAKPPSVKEVRAVLNKKVEGRVGLKWY